MGDGDVLYMRKEKSCDEESANEDDNIWDDTALIEAYDHAVKLAKSEVENRMNGQDDSSSESSASLPNRSSSSHKKSKYTQSEGTGSKKVWSSGNPCRCSYSADGILYEANIVSLGQNGTCIVKYVGYDNEEEVRLSDLLPSRGQHSRHQQELEANPQNEPHETKTPRTHTPKQQYRKGPSASPVQQAMDWEAPLHHQTRPIFTHDMGLPPPPLGLPHMMVPPPPPLSMLAGAGCPSDESEALSAMLMSWYMSGFHTGYYQGMKQATTQTERTPSRRK